MTAAAAPDLSRFDLQGRIGRLIVYPVKSCAGVEVQEALLTETGLEFDRAWMVVDESGRFLSQRELPRMALIRPQMKHYEMVLRAPGMLALHIAYDRVEAPVRVTVWKDEVAAYDMGDVAAQWFSDFLAEPGQPPRRLRLVRFDPEHQRLSSRKWTGEVLAQTQFADGFALLVISQAAVDELNQRLVARGQAPVDAMRFRPNLVLADVHAHDEDQLQMIHIGTEQGAARLQPVKPCIRCSIPDVDLATAQTGTAVADALRDYRADARMQGAVTFGMNVIVRDGVDHLLKVGQPIGADFGFDSPTAAARA
ncbi:MOSC N-terminal beta barrel domain-containing protein [uncultured Pseudacidovorax sp.]|uniref:MOSC domain-containing protein n=1 Tax=uncultured Pseudacidovorax sp. TaxID=679313 RepID=UPI0025E04994|nr:MOSC N-terminal beta barrel domain-containing protein [uncultured Pseudacidovorax sp.]